jgi:hypothetical protein
VEAERLLEIEKLKEELQGKTTSKSVSFKVDQHGNVYSKPISGYEDQEDPFRSKTLHIPKRNSVVDIKEDKILTKLDKPEEVELVSTATNNNNEIKNDTHPNLVKQSSKSAAYQIIIDPPLAKTIIPDEVNEPNKRSSEKHQQSPLKKQITNSPDRPSIRKDIHINSRNNAINAERAVNFVEPVYHRSITGDTGNYNTSNNLLEINTNLLFSSDYRNASSSDESVTNQNVKRISEPYASTSPAKLGFDYMIDKNFNKRETYKSNNDNNISIIEEEGGPDNSELNIIDKIRRNPYKRMISDAETVITKLSSKATDLYRLNSNKRYRYRKMSISQLKNIV